MKDGALSKNSTLWDCLHFFADERTEKIEMLTGSVNNDDKLEGPKNSSYNQTYLSEYFKD